MQNTYEENKELKARLTNLSALKPKFKLKKDNQDLRDVLGEKNTLRDFKPLPAAIIGRNPDRWHEMIIIDKGKEMELNKTWRLSPHMA